MRVAVDGSTFTMAAASAVDTGLTGGGGEASVRALSDAVVSGAGAGRLVLTGSDPPFLTQSHQIPTRRLYPGSAVANAGRGRRRRSKATCQAPAKIRAVDGAGG